MYFISETHLKDGEDISLKCYKWVGQSRKINVRKHQKRVMGGIGFLIRDQLYSEYHINMIDSQFEGVLSLSLKHKKSDFVVIIVGCYLPPENSFHGRDGESYFNYITALLYQLQDSDVILICGDINSRISDTDDILEHVNNYNIDKRQSCDTVKNKHGKLFIDFLHNNDMCVLNGRFGVTSNNFTSISTRGKAVVDYFITAQEHFKYIHTFNIITMNDIKDKFRYCIDEHCRFPDHNILCTEVFTSHNINEPDYNIRMSNAHVGNSCNNDTPLYNVNSWSIVKYKFNNIPSTFMNNDVWEHNISQFYDKLHLFDITDSCIEDIVSNIDSIYDDFVCMISEEMNTHLQKRGMGNKRCKKYKGTYFQNKPYWTHELNILWGTMKQKESEFLCYNGTKVERLILRNNYQTAQWLFDKKLKQCKSKFSIEQQIKLIKDRIQDSKQFWTSVNTLVPRKKRTIPLKVYDNNGILTDDIHVVLDRWQDDYTLLYNSSTASNNDFMSHVENVLYNYRLHINNVHVLQVENSLLNEPIALYEIERTIKRLKYDKASGVDTICNEVLKHPPLQHAIHVFITTCFESGIAPSMWEKSIITPIPKDKSKCIYTPLNYRGISLLCTLSKVYSSILSVRINEYCELLDIIVDEQNGFRRDRSCNDHIFSITTIARNVISQKRSFVCAFIDFKKAFDCINRDLLKYRLLSYNIDGKIFNAIQSLYVKTQSTVKLNDVMTNFFDVTCGVKQGDNLSPTLFSLFINDLAIHIKELHCGVRVGNDNVSILLYADDIILLSECERQLQTMLTYLNGWCLKWCLNINVLKSSIIHFRPKKVPRSTVKFTCGKQSLDFVDSYTYLGIILDEHMSFSPCIKSQYLSGSRAFSSIVSKFNMYKNFTYDIFLQLYNSCVIPSMLYGAESWGFIHSKDILQIQYRALRFFMGVHQSTPIPAMMGDMGWTDILIKQSTCIIRFWNRLVEMDNCRITKRIFNWDRSLKNGCWNNHVCSLFSSINYDTVYISMSKCDIKRVESKLVQNYVRKWQNSIVTMPKLRTYVLFKHEFIPEVYITKCMSRRRRSLMSQFRTGILPLEIETGRYTPIYDKIIKQNRRRIPTERICKLCVLNEIENEYHFLCICPVYNNLRIALYNKICVKHRIFMNMPNADKFNYMLTHCQMEVSIYIADAWTMRQATI